MRLVFFVVIALSCWLREIWAQCSSYSGLTEVTVSSFDQLSCAFSEDVPSITVNASITFPSEIYVASSGVVFYLRGENGAVLSAQTTRLFNISSSSSINFADLALLGSASTTSNVDKGGLIFAQQASLSFTNCSLSSGASLCGGAMYLQSSQLLLTNSSLSNNEASSSQPCGGALHLSAGSAVLTRVTAVNNKAAEGGALLVQAAARLSLDQCSFSYNSADDSGGAVYSMQSVVSAESSVFSDNAAGGDGGALLFQQSNVTLRSCNLTHNSAQLRGGALLQLALQLLGEGQGVLLGGEGVLGEDAVRHAEAQ
eukprot:gene40061-48816_t